MPTYFYAQIRLNRPTIYEDPMTGIKENTVEWLWEHRAFYNEKARETFLETFDPMIYSPITENATAVSARAVKTAQVTSSERHEAIVVLKQNTRQQPSKPLIIS